jgi:AcrR family transcriptional regulator
MQETVQKSEGLRERKRRQTLQRIAEVGVKSFLAKGYEATTLEEIAAAAGISRRTFFHYFKSKDEILVAQLGSYADVIKASVVENTSAGTPLDIAHEALLKVVNGFRESQMIAIARLMQESGALRHRRYASYLQFEQGLYEGLCELWPGKEHERLRVIAMVSIGALRLSVGRWQQESGKRPLVTYFQDTFKNLKAAIQHP